MTTHDARTIRERLKDTEWTLDDEGMIRRDLALSDFAHALLFVNAIGHLAEAHDHHPDLLLHGYKNVRIRLSSHDAGGITDRDFALAEAIDAIPTKKA